MLVFVQLLHLIHEVLFFDQVVGTTLTKDFAKWLILFLQVLELVLLLLHQLVDELTQGIGALIEQCLHQGKQFLLAAPIEQVLSDLDTLILGETGRNLIGQCSSIDLRRGVHLRRGSVSEVVHDLVLFLLGDRVVSLFAAVPAFFQSLEQLGILTLSFALHLLGQIVLIALQLGEKPLLFAVIVVAFRDLNLHLLSALLNFYLFLGVLLIERAKNAVDLLFLF